MTSKYLLKNKGPARLNYLKKNRRLPAGRQGFTILETLAALSIITFIMLGPLTLASFSIKSARISKNRVIASYLAQGAMEYIKNQRDSNIINNEMNWLNGMPGICFNSPGCAVDTTIDYFGGAFPNCGGNCDSLKIKYDPALSYNHSSGDDTIFIRTFIITEIVSNQEARVLVTVSWDEVFGVTKSFVIEDYIFNWW